MSAMDTLRWAQLLVTAFRNEHLPWWEQWIHEGVRTLTDSGVFFPFDLPRRNIPLGTSLASQGITFQHRIALELSSCLPIAGRLCPKHYPLIYCTKGEPCLLRRARTPIDRCRHCGGEIKLCGGHRKAMNPNGVNLKDMWTDVPPVRHKKFTPQSRAVNSIGTKILDPVIEISTEPGDLVLDPFGDSGTTYTVCHQRGRKWIGAEIGDVEPIRERLNGSVTPHLNGDYVELCPA